MNVQQPPPAAVVEHGFKYKGITFVADANCRPAKWLNDLGPDGEHKIQNQRRIARRMQTLGFNSAVTNCLMYGDQGMDSVADLIADGYDNTKSRARYKKHVQMSFLDVD